MMAEGPGFSIVFGPCLVCRAPFTYNPEHVPSHPARAGMPSTDPTDPKEPICASCIAVVNAERARLGQPTWHVHPDAYAPMEGWPA